MPKMARARTSLELTYAGCDGGRRESARLALAIAAIPFMDDRASLNANDAKR